MDRHFVQLSKRMVAFLQAEVVWDAIPSGQSCWFDAFNLIWKGKV